MIVIENQNVHSDTEDIKVRRRGTTENGWSGMSLLPGETADDFEEIEPQEEPPFSEEERIGRIVSLIRRRYSADDEFALQRKMLSVMLHPKSDPAQEVTPSASDADADSTGIISEFEAYNAYVEECKREATAALLARQREAEAVVTIQVPAEDVELEKD